MPLKIQLHFQGCYFSDVPDINWRTQNKKNRESISRYNHVFILAVIAAKIMPQWTDRKFGYSILTMVPYQLSRIIQQKDKQWKFSFIIHVKVRGKKNFMPLVGLSNELESKAPTRTQLVVFRAIAWLQAIPRGSW